MNSFALLALAALGIATPGTANDLFYGSKEMNAYKRALDELTVLNLTAFVVARFEGGPRTAVLNPITFKNLNDIWFGDVNSSDNGSCWSNQIGKLCAWKEQ